MTIVISIGDFSAALTVSAVVLIAIFCGIGRK